MNRPSTLALTLAGLLGLDSFVVGADALPDPRRLNVLFIVADDLNTDLGCYGHPTVQTPHLDRLASRGVRFDRAYCQWPVCNPSRASFLSGRYAGGGGALKDALFLPDFFSKNGYVSIEVGKVSHGFGSSALARWDVQEPRSSAANVVALLEKHRDRSFFLAAGLTHTHPGFSHTREFLQLYPPEKIPLLDEPAGLRKTLPASAFQGINVEDLAPADHRQHVARYHAAISTLDAEVGAIMAGLDRLGLREKTVVLFTSDHGRQLGDHGGVYDKRTLFERSARVPLIVAAPGKMAGAVSQRLVEMVDFYPTFAELCGLQGLAGVEGTSFVPLLTVPDRPWKKAAFTSTSGYASGRSVRTERFRYSEWKDGKEAMLFDHESDPREYANLASDPKHAATVAEMRRLLQAGWRAAGPPAP